MEPETLWSRAHNSSRTETGKWNEGRLSHSLSPRCWLWVDLTALEPTHAYKQINKRIKHWIFTLVILNSFILREMLVSHLALLSYATCLFLQSKQMDKKNFSQLFLIAAHS